MLKFKAMLSVGLFAVGLIYWSLNEFTDQIDKTSNPYNTIYAITGDEISTVEILKCADLKSVETFTSHESCCSGDLNLQTQKKCLEDWFETELIAKNQY